MKTNGSRNQKLSLYPLTPEQAMKIAMETPLPRKEQRGKPQKKAGDKKAR
jgi:hypothetical protein